jgi:hypothetical protein
MRRLFADCLTATSIEQVTGWHYDNDTPRVRKKRQRDARCLFAN